MNFHTFTSSGGDFSKGVITAVTLTTNDSSFTGTLTTNGVAGSRLRANRETVTGIASVLTLWTVVVFLQEDEKIQMTNIIFSLLKESKVKFRFFCCTNSPYVNFTKQQSLWQQVTNTDYYLQNNITEAQVHKRHEARKMTLLNTRLKFASGHTRQNKAAPAKPLSVVQESSVYFFLY